MLATIAVRPGASRFEPVHDPGVKAAMRRFVPILLATAPACSQAAEPAVAPLSRASAATTAVAEPTSPSPASATANSARAPLPKGPAVIASERLAGDIVDDDAMAYSASEKAFAFRIVYLQAGMGWGLSVDFMGED